MYASPHENKGETVKKWHKYIKQCKEALWKRWKHDYLVALRQKRNIKQANKTFKMNVGDVVMVKGEDKNWGHSKIDIANHLHIGKASVIGLAQLRIGIQVNRR